MFPGRLYACLCVLNLTLSADTPPTHNQVLFMSARSSGVDVGSPVSQDCSDVVAWSHVNSYPQLRLKLHKANKSDIYVEVSAFKQVTEENFQLNLFTMLFLKRTRTARICGKFPNLFSFLPEQIRYTFRATCNKNIQTYPLWVSLSCVMSTIYIK